MVRGSPEILAMAKMITDTANFRYPHYHTAEDTVDKIDFDSLARLVTGLRASLVELTGGGDLS